MILASNLVSGRIMRVFEALALACYNIHISLFFGLEAEVGGGSRQWAWPEELEGEGGGGR